VPPSSKANSKKWAGEVAQEIRFDCDTLNAYTKQIALESSNGCGIHAARDWPAGIQSTAIPDIVLPADGMPWTLEISGVDLWTIFEPS
jgi:hypothetical protein